MTVRALAFFLLLPALVVPIRAERALPSPSNLHQWGAVTLFHGLPSNRVRAIAQTPDGALWFGTDNGLARYDGRRVQKIGSGPFASGRVLALTLDDDGALWVGTEGGAARVVNGALERVALTNGKVITAIASAGRGHAVLGTTRGEILDCALREGADPTFNAIGPDDHWLLRDAPVNGAAGPPIPIASLLLTREALLIGTSSRGLLTLNPNDLVGASRSPDFIREIKSQPRAFFVNALAKDGEGRVWYGADAAPTSTGLYKAADLMRPERVGSSTGAITALHADDFGGVWIGTEANGVMVVREGSRIEPFTFENTGGGLLSNHVHAVFVDREGVVWFGTDSGASRYDPHGPHVESVSPASESNFVRALLLSSTGTLWSGTNRGLFQREGVSNWREIPELKGRIVHALAEDSEGGILAGTASGLFIGAIDGNRAGPFVRLRNADTPGDNIRAIRLFKDAIYIANYGTGLERLEYRPESPAPDELTRTLVWPIPNSDDDAGRVARQRRVSSLHVDGDRLWIGTAEEGVFVFDGAQTTSEPALAEMIGASVWSIAGSRAGTLWVGATNGLYAWRRGALTVAIPNVDARSVAIAETGSADQRSAWCGTIGAGLYKVVLDGPGGATLVSKIDSEQGLPSQNLFSVLPVWSSSGSETLWIGASHGIARYEPGRVAPGLNIARALGKRVYTADEAQAGLELEYPQNSLAVEVAATSSRTFPEQFQYAFSVMDATGQSVTEKLSRDAQLLLENLKPGRYRVEVGAFTKDLIASSAMRFEFAVAPAPFPWTSAALSVLLILALLAMVWGYRQNSRLVGANATLESTNTQLAETRLQLANETETERRRIARDLHDQTLADLRRLMMLTDRLPDGAGELQARQSEFRREIESVSTEVRRICEDLSPSALANVGLSAALEWAVAEASASQPAGAEFAYECALEPDIEEKARLSAATDIQVYRIVQEALSNVCKHAGASWVKLTMSLETDLFVRISLEDNGRGFTIGQTAQSGRGLSNIRSRASMIEATADWTPREGGGTVFTLRTPQE